MQLVAVMAHEIMARKMIEVTVGVRKVIALVFVVNAANEAPSATVRQERVAGNGGSIRIVSLGGLSTKNYEQSHERKDLGHTSTSFCFRKSPSPRRTG
jgi:hypothetical protein